MALENNSKNSYINNSKNSKSENNSGDSKEKIENQKKIKCPFDLEESKSEEKKLSENEKQMKDSQFNHSKLFRQIELMLLDLEMDFNDGIIIQMNIQDKIALRDKI
jgi:hypothetical protein